MHNAARFGFIVLMPVTMVVFELSKDFFSILVPRFGPSILIVQIVAAITFIDLFCRIGWAALVAHGRGGLSAIAYVAAAAVNVALNAILIPRYGIVGAAAAVLATFIILAAIILVMARRVTGGSIGLIVWLHPFFLALVYLLLGRLTAGMNEFLRIAIVAVGGSALYIAGAFTTRLVTAEDLARIRAMLLPRAAAPHVRLALAALGAAERINDVLNSKRTGKP
jgi:O-antigen/teichoic acid export membrane protein